MTALRREAGEPQRSAGTIPEKQYDRRALSVAKAALAASGAELGILFGSRARGDYNGLQSDIDILLLQEETPDTAAAGAAGTAALNQAREAYGHEVPVQLIWRTPEAFRHNRRYANSVETNAMREGIIMPRDPENYRAEDYEDEETEYEHDWTDYDNRLFHAEQHLELFEVTTERGMNDLLIGQEAQKTLEHGLKALVAAYGAEYPKTHNIGALIGKVREHDRHMQHFRLGIPADVYSEYAGEDTYNEIRKQPKLTEYPNYVEATASDAKFIIERAKAIYAQSQQEDRCRP